MTSDDWVLEFSEVQRSSKENRIGFLSSCFKKLLGLQSRYLTVLGFWIGVLSKKLWFLYSIKERKNVFLVSVCLWIFLFFHAFIFWLLSYPFILRWYRELRFYRLAERFLVRGESFMPDLGVLNYFRAVDWFSVPCNFCYSFAIRVPFWPFLVART